MALIELVDYNEVYGKDAAAAEKKTTRRGRSKTKKADSPGTEEVVAEAPAAEGTEATPAAPSEEAPKEA